MTDDSTATDYNDEEYGDDYSPEEVAEERAEEERENTSLYKIEYYAWGVIHLGSIVTGFLLSSWYSGLVTNNAWLKIQCPDVAYTDATGAVAPLALYKGSATLTAVAPNGWTKEKCLAAAPIKQWMSESWWMIISYGLGLLIWTLNLILDNKGGKWHMAFLYFSQLHLLIVPFGTIIYDIIAVASYGTRL